ncbi:response regulator [Flavisolibacter nicotianae]|uniref:response regulator n=1 Tax=Flavisolibacter nicotianae TaxID=2364882 RepID=UPI000EAD4FEB|nr:response regulator [Flavisolibacter nicotianae]
MKTYKIIVVENDEDEQFFMKEGFDSTGLFEIITMVKSGDELFEWLEANMDSQPDLILSDLNMPGKNGYDIIDEMKASPVYAAIPVVITSTSSTPTIIAKCLTRGAADYVVKPETFIEYVPYVQGLYQRITDKKLVK